MSRKQVHSEADLIAGVQRNDPKYIDLVYKVNFASIAKFIISNSGTEQEAKDIYQEAFIIFYEKIRDKNFRLTCQIKTYLYSISRRLWLKRLSEKNKYTGKVNEFESFLTADKEESSQGEEEHRFQIMHQALSELGEPCATILKDFYLEKMSLQEICEKMGYTNMANAKTQKYKCLKRLKKIFFEQYGK